MHFPRQNSIDPSTIGRTTAFRMPRTLLKTVDSWCEQNDITRSQFFRHSIMDRVKALGIQSVVQEPRKEERQWSSELYDRLQRRR